MSNKILLDSTGRALLTEDGKVLVAPKSSSGGGSKLYMHSIRINVPTKDGSTGFLFNIITNFNTQLTDNNFGELVFNYFTNNDYGVETIKQKIMITENTHMAISLIINNGDYPGSSNKYIGVNYEQYTVNGASSPYNESGTYRFNLDGTKSDENLRIEKDYVKEL